MTWTCAHCGLTCGDYAGGYGTIAGAQGTIRLCHPNDPARPDCYRRVTLHGEQLGVLRELEHKPAGITDIIGGRDALAELIRLGEEMGLYDEPPRVCVTHGSVQTCRHGAGCEWSADPETVKRVMREQLGTAAREVRDAGPA